MTIGSHNDRALSMHDQWLTTPDAVEGFACACDVDWPCNLDCSCPCHMTEVEREAEAAAEVTYDEWLSGQITRRAAGYGLLPERRES